MDILRQLRQAYRTRRQRQKWQRFVQVMAMIVVFCTTYALILPAITLERTPECGLTEHTHSTQCYESTAEIQPGHTHGDSCYESTLICGLEEHPAHSHTEDCSGQVSTLICTETASDHIHEGTCYNYETGLICGQDETEGHSHAESCYQSDLTCTLTEGSSETDTQPVCGLEEHTHDESCYPETEATEESTDPTEETTAPEEQLHTGSSEDGIQAQVALDAGTAVPADAAVTVTPVTAEDEVYGDHVSQVDAQVEEQILDLALLDISFYDTAGEYLSVEDTAQVTLTFDGSRFGLNPVKVFHFVDGVPVELENVSVSHAALTAEDGTETIQTNLTFQTDGFSVFALVEVAGRYEQVTPADVTQMEGEYFILGVSLSDALGTTDNAVGTTHGVLSNNLSACTLWTFTEAAADTNTYYIYSATHDKYLTIGSEGGIDTADTQENATAITLTTVADQNYVFLSNGEQHYLNLHGGSAGGSFSTWTANDGGSQIYLYREKQTTDDVVSVTNLAGQSFAIVNETTNMAMLATANGNGLSTAEVTVVTIDGVNYIKGNGIPLWTFTQDEECAVDEYYIHTTVESNIQYLNLNTDQSLTLSETKVKFKVLGSGDTGKVFLNANGFNINKYGGENKFAGYADWGTNAQMTLCLLTDIVTDFTITYDVYAITLHFQDTLGNELTVTPQTITMAAGESLTFADIAPVITDYTYQKATLGSDVTSPEVVSVTTNDGGAFRFYEEDPTKFYTRDANVDLYLVYKSDQSLLYYDLNKIVTNGWVVDSYNDSPSLDEDSQLFTEAVSNLQTVNGKNAAGSFIAHTYSSRGTERTYLNKFNEDNGLTPADDGYRPPGAEWVFLGWQAENLNGETCLFPENAEAYTDELGNICITDVNGTLQTVESGTVLYGQWKLVSNVIYFFVNHGDTMLEGENNQSITSTSSNYYTDIAAIGHIYNVDKLGDDNYFDPEGYIQTAIHNKIVDLFRAEYDPTSDEPQIVVDAIKVISDSGTSYEPAENYNEALLEAAIAVYIQSQTGKTILLDGAELDKADITPENYKLYWYGLKLVGTDANTYHMDGVLVARTQTMEIYKTFSGLERTQAESIIGNMEFPLYLIHTTDGTDVKDDYTTLIASSSQEGVYTADGWQSSGSNIFKWTLESVQGQRYAFEETGYGLTDYECFSLVSVHYKDGTVEYRYSTDATYTDLDTTQNTITDLYAAKPLEGGKIESVIFANFYTPTGTGMFSISKVADEAGQVRLSGATFTLTNTQTNEAITDVTNENGAAHFSGLEAGTYTLTETSPPSGYQKLDQTWQVVVASTQNGTTDSSGNAIDRVTVTIYEVEGTEVAKPGTLLYDNGSADKPGIQEVYLVQNTPEVKTLTVNKVFSNITESEVGTLTDYCIELQDSAGNAVQDTDGNTVTLTLANATPITGVMNGYTWTLTGIEQSAYQLVEKGFVHDNYLDTVVTATATETEETTALTVTKSDDKTVATIPVTKGDKALTADITNDYTNTFTLKILKVDATNSNAPMDNVQFKIYGEFGEGGGESITYTDDKGDTHTVYLVGSVETGTDGTALYEGMKLSSGSRSFLYVIDEVATPTGYVKLSEPIVRVVDIDSDNYSNGVYTLTIENFQVGELLAQVTLTATKEWTIPDGIEKPAVTFNLYRKDSDGSATKLHSVTLTGDDVPETTDGGFVYTITDGWTVTWSGLPYAAADSDTRYEYYVAEEHIPGYSTTYSTYLETLTVDGAQVQAARAKDSAETQLKRQITVTNTTGYELPDTGGFGTCWYTTFGFVLILACIWLYWHVRYKKKRGGADTS